MKKKTMNIATERRSALSLKPAVGFRGSKDRMARFANNIQRPTTLARGRMEVELDRLRDNLLQPLLEQANDVALLDLLRLAGNEAAAAAWLTPYPLLFLPALLEEKTRKASQQVARQKAILRKTQPRTEAVAA